MVRRGMPGVGVFALVLLIVGGGPAVAESGPELSQGREIWAPGAVLDERSRVEPVNAALEERLDALLPQLMREVGLDMWLVINREYAEDPVYLTPGPGAGLRGPPNDDAGVLRPGTGRGCRKADRQPLSTRRVVPGGVGGGRSRRAVAASGRVDRGASAQANRRQRESRLAGGRWTHRRAQDAPPGEPRGSADRQGGVGRSSSGALARDPIRDGAAVVSAYRGAGARGDRRSVLESRDHTGG